MGHTKQEFHFYVEIVAIGVFAPGKYYILARSITNDLLLNVYINEHQQ